MKRNKKTRYSKKRIKEIKALLKNRIEIVGQVNSSRFKQLYKYADIISRFENRHHNKKFNMENYKSINPTSLFEIMGSYKDMFNREGRKFAIQMSRTFCCPITKEIMDMDKTLFIKSGGKKCLISFGAFNQIVKKLGLEKALTMVEF